MANAFSKGDLVKLKSGGPVMTIDLCPGEAHAITLDDIKDYKCVWFKGSTEQSGWFGEHLLLPAAE